MVKATNCPFPLLLLISHLLCVFFLLLPAEAEGEEYGRLEEHTWSSSLGGLQTVPGTAAEQVEPRARCSWLEACH